jgi:hypothetical protein
MFQALLLESPVKAFVCPAAVSRATCADESPTRGSASVVFSSVTDAVASMRSL